MSNFAYLFEKQEIIIKTHNPEVIPRGCVRML